MHHDWIGRLIVALGIGLYLLVMWAFVTTRREDDRDHFDEGL